MRSRGSRKPPAPTGAEVVQWLLDWRDGDRVAGERLREKLAARLARVALQTRWQQGGGELAAASEVVRGLYAEIEEATALAEEDLDRFVSIAAGELRRVLVDCAFRRSEEGDPRSFDEAVSLDRAIDRLAGLDPQLGRLVELRCLVGLSLEQAARAAGIPVDSAQRDWQRARALFPARIGRSGAA